MKKTKEFILGICSSLSGVRAKAKADSQRRKSMPKPFCNDYLGSSVNSEGLKHFKLP